MAEQKNLQGLQRLISGEVAQGNKRVHTATVNCTEFGDDYKGKFTFHHPSLMEKMNIGVTKTQLLQGLEGRVDVVTDNIAHMTATLAFVCDESPEWFKIDEIVDYGILDKVYDEYFRWYENFRKSSGRDDNGKDSGESNS